MGIGGQQRSLTFVPVTRSCVCVCGVCGVCVCVCVSRCVCADREGVPAAHAEDDGGVQGVHGRLGRVEHDPHPGTATTLPYPPRLRPGPVGWLCRAVGPGPCRRCDPRPPSRTNTGRAFTPCRCFSPSRPRSVPRDPPAPCRNRGAAASSRTRVRWNRTRSRCSTVAGWRAPPRAATKRARWAAVRLLATWFTF